MQKVERPADLVDRLPELISLERIIKSLQGQAEIREEAFVPYKEYQFPIYSITLGSKDPTAPTLGIFGGVHGLERIGTEVIIAWLSTIAELLQWDAALQHKLEKTRLVFMPLVNPVGMYLRYRSNPNSVDLMRNAPVEADAKPAFLLGGHRLSKSLPWYRGHAFRHEDMEIESKALAELVMREVLPSRRSLTIDVHSGFGSIDRLWFPYARAKTPPPHLAEIMALKRLYDQTYTNHVYRLEPQAKVYTTHGDLWDYLYDMKNSKSNGDIYIPWTLELGSWMWLKKNPRQFFSALGPFNPIQPHRIKRTLRRHIPLFEFLHRAIMSSEPWTKLDEEMRLNLETRAKQLWYDDED